jgi:hypothetical protein
MSTVAGRLQARELANQKGDNRELRLDPRLVGRDHQRDEFFVLARHKDLSEVH